MQEPEVVRRPAVAGFFYPSGRAEAEKQVDTLRFRARRELLQSGMADVRPKAVVVPHAGWAYSGRLAAKGWCLLANDVDVIRRVVLIGPTHRVPVRGVAVSPADAFETPLGLVPVAGLPDAAREAGVVADSATHADEHALEVQLPFLQRLLPTAEIIPLNAGIVCPDDVADVVEALWGGPETRIVVSTDLSHYLPRQFQQIVDEETIEKVMSADPAITHDEACGAAPLNGMLTVCRRRGLSPVLIDRSDSSEASGDPSRVVGYASFHIEED